MRTTLLVLLFVVTTRAAVAQPEFWGVGAFGSVSVYNARTGQQLTVFQAPPDVCIAAATMSADKRSYYALTNVGVGRIDVATRRLVEFAPMAASCGTSSWLAVSPSGRWWHVRDGLRHIVIDSITKAMSEQADPPDIVRFDRDGMRRYELSTRYDAGAYQSTLRGWPDGPASTPLWSVEYEGSAHDVATGPDGVYVAINTSGLVVIRRLDLASGAELGRTEKQLTDPFATARALHVFQGRLFLGAANPQTLLPPIVHATQTLASFDAITLAPTASVDQEDTSNIGPFLFDTAASVGYVARPFCYRFTCWDNLTSFDPITLIRTGNVSFVGTSFHKDRALGEVRAPGRVRLDGTASADRIVLAWQPEASGAVPSTFEIRGALRGGSLQQIATVDGTAREWISGPLPRGSYTLGVVARNYVGTSDPARADVGIQEMAAPDAPTNLVASSGDDVTRIIWQSGASGPAPSGYIVEGAPAGSTAFVAVAQTVLPEFFTRVPIGTWQARVRALTDAGSSPPSNVVSITSRLCTTAPGAPFDLATVTGGTVVTLQWREPSTGVPAEYVMEVGSYPGLTDLGRFTMPASRAAIQLTAPRGVYVARVRARNTCGESAASNEVILRVS
jgi:hypothetical protein